VPECQSCCTAAPTTGKMELGSDDEEDIASVKAAQKVSKKLQKEFEKKSDKFDEK